MALVRLTPSQTAATPSAAVHEPSARLSMTSAAQGLLPPWMSKGQRLAITAPVRGAIVHDTDLHVLCVRGPSRRVVLTAP